MRDGTYIKLFRSIQKWKWYQNGNTFRVFFHILLNANVKSHDFENIKINRGEWATSYEKIANTLKLTYQEVRTALTHLKSTKEITITRYSKFVVITVLNYELYQNKSTNKSTINQQSLNNQSTINQQQYKKDKNVKNDNKERKNILSNNINIYNSAKNADNITPSLDDVKNYIAEKNLNVDAEKFYSLYSSKGWVSAKGFPIDYRSKLEEWHCTELKQPNNKKQYLSDKQQTYDLALAEKMLKGRI